MATVVVPGETLEARKEREARWTCETCRCVFVPGPDDVREAMGREWPDGTRTPLQWFALCPNGDCGRAVLSGRRATFDDWGPRFNGPVGTARPLQPPSWRHDPDVRKAILGASTFFFVMLAVALLAMVMR